MTDRLIAREAMRYVGEDTMGEGCALDDRSGPPHPMTGWAMGAVSAVICRATEVWNPYASALACAAWHEERGAFVKDEWLCRGKLYFFGGTPFGMVAIFGEDGSFYGAWGSHWEARTVACVFTDDRMPYLGYAAWTPG